MDCRQGAKVFCKYSWETSGYASEQACISAETQAQCPSFTEKLKAFVLQPVVWGSAAAIIIGIIIYKVAK